MPEPSTIFSGLKSLLGVFGAIAKELLKRYNQPKLVAKAVFIRSVRDTFHDPRKPPQRLLPLPLLPFSKDERELEQFTRELEEAQRKQEEAQREQSAYEAALRTVRAYRMTWTFEVTVTNNTEHTAYRLKFLPPDSVRVIGNVDYTKPVPANESITHTVEAHYTFTGTLQEAETRLKEGLPLTLRLEYDNARSIRHFTLFNSALSVEEQNNFGRVK